MTTQLRRIRMGLEVWVCGMCKVRCKDEADLDEHINTCLKNPDPTHTKGVLVTTHAKLVVMPAKNNNIPGSAVKLTDVCNVEIITRDKSKS